MADTEKKAKNCKTGASCGYSCISKTHTCRSVLNPGPVKVAEAAMDMITRARLHGPITLGQGYQGTVTLEPDGVALKVYRDDGPKFARATPEQRTSEANVTEIAGKLGIGPKVISKAFDSDGNVNSFRMEFLNGYKPLTSKSGDSLGYDANFSLAKTLQNKDNGSALLQIAKLHEAGLSHGDLHGGNIMTKDGEAKIIDYGFGASSDRYPKRMVKELVKAAGQEPGSELKNDYKPGSKEAKVYDVMLKWANSSGTPKNIVDGYRADLSQALK